MNRTPLNIAILGSLPVVNELQAQVDKYAPSTFSCVLGQYGGLYSVPSGTYGQDNGYHTVDQVNPKENIVLLCYSSPNPAVALTFYYPKRDCTVSLIPTGLEPRLVAFEISHALQLLINAHGLKPPIIIEDTMYPDDAFISRKYASVIPYLNLLESATIPLMTEKEVKLYYLMAFNRLPAQDELTFWSGKKLLDLLEAGIKDRATLLAGNQL